MTPDSFGELWIHVYRPQLLPRTPRFRITRYDLLDLEQRRDERALGTGGPQVLAGVQAGMRACVFAGLPTIEPALLAGGKAVLAAQLVERVEGRFETFTAVAVVPDHDVGMEYAALESRTVARTSGRVQARSPDPLLRRMHQTRQPLRGRFVPLRGCPLIYLTAVRHPNACGARPACNAADPKEERPPQAQSTSRSSFRHPTRPTPPSAAPPGRADRWVRSRGNPGVCSGRPATATAGNLGRTPVRL